MTVRNPARSSTMKLSLAEERRLEVSYHTGRFMIDHLVRLYAMFEGDLTASIVLGTVAQHNVQRYYDEIAKRSPAGFDRLVEQGDHLPHMRPCNALSVSAATGIPRETVRRKVRWLTRKGWLTVGERGQLAVGKDVRKQFEAFDRQTSRRLEVCVKAIAAVHERPSAHSTRRSG
jgi:hypothetical protein